MAIPEEWPVKYPGGAWARLFFFSFIGVAPAPVVLAALFGMDLAEWSGLEHRFDFGIFVMCVCALLAAIVLPLVCLKIREPGPAKVVFDDWGVTEWDGDRVRTAIAWARARIFQLEIRIRDKYGSVYAGGNLVSVASDRGWAVNVSWGRVMKNGWRRRMTSKVQFPPHALSPFAASVPRMEAAVSDPRDERRPLFHYARTVGFFYLAGIGLAFSQLNDLGSRGQQSVGAAFVATGILALMRMARPIGENMRLAKEAAPCARATLVTLPSGNDGPFVVAQTNDDGRQVTLDFSAVNHPDELIVRRGGRMWVAQVEGGALTGDGYRNAPVRVLAAETDGDRRERTRLRRANRIEIVMRTALGIGLLASAGILLMSLQVH